MVSFFFFLICRSCNLGGFVFNSALFQVFWALMFLPATADCVATMLCTYAVPMSMVLLPRQRLWRRIVLLSKSVISNNFLLHSCSLFFLLSFFFFSFLAICSKQLWSYLPYFYFQKLHLLTFTSIEGSKSVITEGGWNFLPSHIFIACGELLTIVGLDFGGVSTWKRHSDA